MLTSHYLKVILLVTSISQSICLNALFISDGAAGHVTPIFELAKAMKSHNVTFLTQQAAKSYLDLNLPSSPQFRIIFANDSIDAFSYEKNLEQNLIQTLANQSLLEVLHKVILFQSNFIKPLLNKTIHILMHDRFDVIVASSMAFGIPVLCEKIQTPCVVQSSAALPNLFDFTLPNAFSLLTSKQLLRPTYRIYNALFNVRLAIKLVPKMIPTLYTIFQSLPQIPGPFYDSYTIKNLLSSNSKSLNLLSIPATFYTSPYSHQYVRYLGAFVDETSIVDDNDDALTAWIKSKPTSSIIYGAFGSSSLIPYDRMYNLVSGIAMFLFQTDNSFLLLALRNANYETYQAVLKQLRSNKMGQTLENKQRVWIEKGFVKQKWILQQSSVKVFVSHCGMGSLMEALYFSKSILGMPFSGEQFSNAIAIENLNVGQSLLIPPSIIQNLLKPYDLVNYSFTIESVTNKVLNLWTNVVYERAAQQLSLEMKHAGGVKRAVEEIEFFVNLNGDLDRFIPFETTLWYYQRYKLDLLLIFVTFPGLFIMYIVSNLRKEQRKTKTD